MNHTKPDTDPTPSNVDWVQMGAITAIALFVAYAAAFVFEYRYLSMFGVPGHLARVGIEQLLFAAVGLMLVLGLIIAAGFLVNSVTDSLAGDYRDIPWRIFFAALALPLLLLVVGRTPFLLILTVLVIMIYLWWEFGPPLLRKSSRQSWPRYTRRLQALARLRAKGTERMPRFALSFSRAGWILAGFSIMALPLANLAAQAFAINQETFLRADQPTSHVILRIYGDVVVGISLDDKTRRLRPQVIVRKLGVSDSTTMTVAELGPLASLTGKPFEAATEDSSPAAH